MTVAVLLAAGKSDFHDGLLSHVEVGGQRLIDLQVACLRTSGAEDVVVVAGHEAESLDRADIVLVHNPEWSGTGSITSLQRAAYLFDGKNDIVVGYGDTIFDPEVLRALYRSPGPISCACLLDRSGQDVDAYREFAQIEDGELKAVSPTAQTKGLRTVFCGLLFVRAGVAEAVGRYLNERVCPPSAHVGEFVNAMLAHGTAVTPVIIEHGWAEITNAANYTRLLNNQRLLDVVLSVHTDWTRRSVRYDQLQREAPEYVRRAYGMRFEDGDCLMTWRFAVTWGTSPGPLT